MEPVIGLDVSKGMSVAQAFTTRNEKFGKTTSIPHTDKGFGQLGELIGELHKTDRNGYETTNTLRGEVH